MKKIVKIGVFLSILGLLVYILPAKLVTGYEQVGSLAGLILFATGWSLSLGGFLFHLGMQKERMQK